MKDDLENEIICVNCGITAKEFFEGYKQEKVPSYFYDGMTWYCCEQCYDEYTKDES